MARITKAPEERRREIIETSERLFREVGYAKCSVEMVIREIGVAKGTFYYYFKSKDEILTAIADSKLDLIIEQAEQVADAADLDALQKMKLLLSDSRVGDVDTDEITDMLHLPENRELHELINVKTVWRLSPVLARIVSQGNQEGVFATIHPLETIQILLAGGHFLLDGGLFSFSEAEQSIRKKVLQEIVEKSLGAVPGSFNFMNREFEES